MPIRASSLAMTRSAQSAKSLPPPTHQPCTCAITGLGERQTLMNFCVGDALSFADVALVPQLYFARRFGISLEEMPTLRRIEATCAAMACFQVAHAERQPDAPRI